MMAFLSARRADLDNATSNHGAARLDVQFGAEVQSLIVAFWCRGLHPAEMIVVLDRMSAALEPALVDQAEIALPVSVAGSGAGEPVSPCEGTHTLRAGWRRFAGVCRRIEEMWIGDLLGAAALFALLWMVSLLTLLE